jgi:hypothetical protein
VKTNGRIDKIPREHVGGERELSGDVLGWSGEALDPPPRREVPFSFVSCGWEKRRGGDAVCPRGRKKG